MSDTVRQRLARRFDSQELRAIKRLWVRHSIAEDRRDIDGLLATLADECEYEIVPTGQHWHGLDGVRAFYSELFAAFPDNRFELTEIVVGPQGVFEAARLTGTNLGPWAGVPASGLPVDLEVLIYFPWDPATQPLPRRADLVRPRSAAAQRRGQSLVVVGRVVELGRDPQQPARRTVGRVCAARRRRAPRSGARR